MKARLFLLIVVIMFLLSGCVSIHFDPANQIVGSGNTKIEERTVQGFDSVRLEGSGNVSVEIGDTESLTVEADDNLLPYITTEVKGGVLVLGTKPNTNIISTRQVIFRVVMKELNGLAVHGSGNISLPKVQTGTLSLEIPGSGDIQIGELQADRIDASIDGSGTIRVTGAAGTQEIRINGSGKYYAGDLQSQATTIRILGSGDAQLWVEDNLSATIAGSGNVDYYGAPQQVDVSTPGSGDVTRLGDKN